MFLLVITLLLLKMGGIAAWILAVGLARYTLDLAGRMSPPLARPLPQSTGRKSLDVATVIALLPALSPFFGGRGSALPLGRRHGYDRGIVCDGLLMASAQRAPSPTRGGMVRLARQGEISGREDGSGRYAR